MSPIHANQTWAKVGQVKPFLYIGGAITISPNIVKELQITCLINATREAPSIFVPGVAVQKLWILDTPETDISPWFDQIADQIATQRGQNGRVLVHCVAGVSRSAALVLAYLVKHEDMSLREAYNYLARLRPMVRPNSGFWRQLMEFEVRLRHHQTVQFVQVPECAGTGPVPDVYLISTGIEEEDEEAVEAEETNLSSECEAGYQDTKTAGLTDDCDDGIDQDIRKENREESNIPNPTSLARTVDDNVSNRSDEGEEGAAERLLSNTVTNIQSAFLSSSPKESYSNYNLSDQLGSQYSQRSQNLLTPIPSFTNYNKHPQSSAEPLEVNPMGSSDEGTNVTFGALINQPEFLPSSPGETSLLRERHASADQAIMSSKNLKNYTSSIPPATPLASTKSKPRKGALHRVSTDEGEDSGIETSGSPSPFSMVDLSKIIAASVSCTDTVLTTRRRRHNT